MKAKRAIIRAVEQLRSGGGTPRRAAGDVSQWWTLEALEARRVLSAAATVVDGVLIYNCTAGADKIVVALEPNLVWIEADLPTDDVQVPLAGLRGIRIDGGAGNDRILVAETAAE